jgi:hypothetical protein
MTFDNLLVYIRNLIQHWHPDKTNLVQGEHETSSKENCPSETAEAMSKNPISIGHTFPDLAKQVCESSNVVWNHSYKQTFSIKYTKPTFCSLFI